MLGQNSTSNGFDFPINLMRGLKIEELSEVCVVVVLSAYLQALAHM